MLNRHHISLLSRPLNMSQSLSASPLKASRSMSTTVAAHKGSGGYGANFPTSTARPSTLFRFPGGSEESTRLVREVLTENDHRFDIYESARYAHNHFSHSVLSRYALGAPPKLLRDTWLHDKQHLVSLEPEADDRKTDMGKVPERIDEFNWKDGRYLGFDGSYSRYLAFFHGEIAKLGPVEVINRYVFSAEANWEGEGAPRMIRHLLGGFWHPFIHVGMAIEFRDSMLLAEGLAEACIHKIDLFETLFPTDWPQSALISDNLTKPDVQPSQNSPQIWNLPQASSHTSMTKGKSLLEIYASICASDELKPILYDPDSLMRDRMLGATRGRKGEILRRLANDWSLTDEELGDGVGPDSGWELKVGEIGVFATLIACATGREGREKKVDFFLMHALTSSIFLPSYMPLLTIPQRRALLTTYVLVILQSAIARGRPLIVPGLLMSQPLYPVAPGTTINSKGSSSSNIKESSSSNAGPNKLDVISDPTVDESRNAWLSVVESCLYAYDSHVPKSIRSLLHWSTRYGHTAPGSLPGSFINSAGDGENKRETFPGMSQADGTIFIRAAGLVMELLGWCREGQKEGHWDFSALGYDESWEGKGAKGK